MTQRQIDESMIENLAWEILQGATWNTIKELNSRSWAIQLGTNKQWEEIDPIDEVKLYGYYSLALDAIDGWDDSSNSNDTIPASVGRIAENRLQ